MNLCNRCSKPLLTVRITNLLAVSRGKKDPQTKVHHFWVLSNALDARKRLAAVLRPQKRLLLLLIIKLFIYI